MKTLITIILILTFTTDINAQFVKFDTLDVHTGVRSIRTNFMDIETVEFHDRLSSKPNIQLSHSTDDGKSMFNFSVSTKEVFISEGETAYFLIDGKKRVEYELMVNPEFTVIISDYVDAPNFIHYYFYYNPEDFIGAESIEFKIGRNVFALTNEAIELFTALEKRKREYGLSQYYWTIGDVTDAIVVAPILVFIGGVTLFLFYRRRS